MKLFSNKKSVIGLLCAIILLSVIGLVVFNKSSADVTSKSTDPCAETGPRKTVLMFQISSKINPQYLALDNKYKAPYGVCSQQGMKLNDINVDTDFAYNNFNTLRISDKEKESTYLLRWEDPVGQELSEFQMTVLDGTVGASDAAVHTFDLEKSFFAPNIDAKAYSPNSESMAKTVHFSLSGIAFDSTTNTRMINLGRINIAENIVTNKPPQAKMIFPTEGKIFKLAKNKKTGTVSIKAQATDPDGNDQIVKVEFFNFVGDASLGVGTLVPNTDPFQFQLKKSFSKGSYSIYAIATDKYGTTSSKSSSIGFTIQ